MKLKNETIWWQKKRWGENETQKRNDLVAKKRWGENEIQNQTIWGKKDGGKIKKYHTKISGWHGDLAF